MDTEAHIFGSQRTTQNKNLSAVATVVHWKYGIPSAGSVGCCPINGEFSRSRVVGVLVKARWATTSQEGKSVPEGPCPPSIIISGSAPRTVVIGTHPRGRTQVSARPCRPCRPRDDVNSSPGATGVVAAPLWGPQTRARLRANLALFAASRGNPADVIAGQPSLLRLQALAIRTHSAAAFLRACGQRQQLAQRCPPSCYRRQTPRSAGTVASAAIDSTLACRWSSFSPSEWALRLVLGAIDMIKPWMPVYDHADEAAWTIKTILSAVSAVSAVSALSTPNCSRISVLRRPHPAAAPTTRTPGSAAQRHRIPVPAYPHSTQRPRLRQRAAGVVSDFCQQRTLDIASGIALPAGLPNRSSSLDITHFATWRLST